MHQEKGGHCSPADKHSSTCTCKCKQDSGDWQRSCLNSGLPSTQSCAEGGGIENHLDLQSPTFKEHRWAWAAHMWVLETEEGALANHDFGQPYRDIKKLGEGNGIGSMKEGDCWGGSGPAQCRQAGLEEHLFGRLGSDRALI